MNHSFNVEIATKYGMLEAILLEHLNFWISKNKANKANFYDGNYWTYNSTKALAELFPYVSSNTISRALRHLKEEGLILFGNYNKISYDRTTWYAITEKGNSILQHGESDLLKCEMDSPKMINGITQNDEMDSPKMINGITQNDEMDLLKMINGITQNDEMDLPKMINGITQNDEMDLSKCKMDSPKVINGFTQNDKPIPDINTDINTDVITVSKDTVRQTESVRRIVAAWNQLEAYGIKSIIKLSSKSKRYDCLVARLKEYGEENVLKAIENIKQSNFLQGKSSDRRKWFITFDWFVLPNNFPKVLEGNYSNDNMVLESNSTKYDKGFQKTLTYNNYLQNPPTAEKESHNPDIFEQLINESRADVMERKGE